MFQGVPLVKSDYQNQLHFRMLFFLPFMANMQVSARQLASSRERDFFRWLKLPMTIYKTQIPIKTDASKSSRVDCRGTETIAMVLPSDHLQALHDQGPEVFCQNHQSFFPNVFVVVHCVDAIPERLECHLL